MERIDKDAVSEEERGEAEQVCGDFLNVGN